MASMDIFEMQKVVENANNDDLWMHIFRQNVQGHEEVTEVRFDSIDADLDELEVVLKTSTVYVGIAWRKISQYFN